MISLTCRILKKKKRYKGIYLPNRKKLTGTENKLVVTERERVGERNRELGININTLLHITHRNNKDLLNSREIYIQYFVIIYKGKGSEDL